MNQIISEYFPLVELLGCLSESSGESRESKAASSHRSAKPQNRHRVCCRASFSPSIGGPKNRGKAVGRISRKSAAKIRIAILGKPHEEYSSLFNHGLPLRRNPLLAPTRKQPRRSQPLCGTAWVAGGVGLCRCFWARRGAFNDGERRLHLQHALVETTCRSLCCAYARGTLAPPVCSQPGPPALCSPLPPIPVGENFEASPVGSFFQTCRRRPPGPARRFLCAATRWNRECLWHDCLYSCCCKRGKIWGLRADSWVNSRKVHEQDRGYGLW